MNVDSWLALLSIVISLGLPAALFVARHWLIARISRGVQHGFDVQIEALRADLRQNEELFKSDLRDKEAEISALRNTVLSGSASRQSLLDKRRFEAVERVWTHVNDMARYKALAGVLAVLDFKAIAKEARDPKMQQFLSVIETSFVPDAKELKNVARDERPFLPELAWAYFTAYSTILLGSFVRFQILKSGVDEPERMLSKDALQKMVKAALPNYSKFIDDNEPEAYFYLVDEIERCLLAELRKILEGKDADQAAAARAKEIMDAVRQAEQERAEQAVAAANAG